MTIRLQQLLQLSKYEDFFFALAAVDCILQFS